MSNNQTLTTTTALTMSSREIADLVEARHDNVKITIERLVDRGVIEFPPSEEIPVRDTLGRTRYISVDTTT